MQSLLHAIHLILSPFTTYPINAPSCSLNPSARCHKDLMRWMLSFLINRVSHLWVGCPLQTGGLSSARETTRLQEEGVPHPFRANYLAFLEGAECPVFRGAPAGVCLVIHMIRQGDAGAPKLGCLFVT